MNILKKITFVLILSSIIISCNKKMVSNKNYHYECLFTGNELDIINFLHPVNKEEKVYLEITKNMYLFYNDTIKVKTYFFENEKGVFESLKVPDFSVIPDSFKRYRVKKIDSTNNSLKLKIYSDSNNYTRMKDYILINITKPNGNSR